jgi:hypothetical protein
VPVGYRLLRSYLLFAKTEAGLKYISPSGWKGLYIGEIPLRRRLYMLLPV